MYVEIEACSVTDELFTYHLEIDAISKKSALDACLYKYANAVKDKVITKMRAYDNVPLPYEPPKLLKAKSIRKVECTVYCKHISEMHNLCEELDALRIPYLQSSEDSSGYYTLECTFPSHLNIHEISNALMDYKTSLVNGDHYKLLAISRSI